jgi:RND family efflux transporter MFP subunit
MMFLPIVSTACWPDMASHGGGAGKRAFLMTLGSGAAIALLLAGCSPTPAARPAEPDAPPLSVQVARVIEQPVERRIFASGSLHAQDYSPISVKVAGHLQMIAVDLGSAVLAGDVIAEVDPRDYELRLKQAGAALAQARVRLGLPLDGDDDQVEFEKVSSVKEAAAVLVEKRAELERLSVLSLEGVASKSHLEAAESAFEVASNRHQEALQEARNRQAVLLQRRAEFEMARKQVADTRILAPFDGSVQERRANLGEYLQVGSPVVTLVRTEPLRLRLEVPERESARVRLGQRVRLFVEGQREPFSGEIKRFSPAIAQQSRMLVVEADVPASGKLRPGAFARAEIITESESPALVIPPSALVTFAGVEKVFTVENGKVTEKFVSTGDHSADYIEVLSGLSPGETIVLDPGGLKAGQTVQTNRPPAS